MAAKGPKGSILLELLIILLALLLVAVILIPNKIWKEEESITKTSRNNMIAIYEAERFYYQKNGSYTDSLTKLLNFVHSDSGLQQRQTLVSLTRSFLQVVDNILDISSVNNISKVSLALYEINGDLVGNERYFRRDPEILKASEEILQELAKFDSSMMFPNFTKTKLYVDSLRHLRESVSDFPLQNGIQKAINFVDSINIYFGNIEREALDTYWKNEYVKISKFISDIRNTDISKVSSVPDRVRKFIDQISSNLNALQNANETKDVQGLDAEKQNLTELHQKFLAPEYFFLTKRYALNSLNETDSILIEFNQNNFYGPDSKKPYIIDTTGGHFTVESPNLLDVFHARFLESVKPIENLPFYAEVNNLDSVYAKTLTRLNDNKTLLRRETDLLLGIKEISAEMQEPTQSKFYGYTKRVEDFLALLQNEKKLSVLKPQIEEVLNPMDTLAAHVQDKNMADLEKQIKYFDDKLKQLDSLIAGTRLSSRIRNKIQSNAEVFQPAFEILTQIKNNLDPAYATALRDASKSLEKNLLNALEGETESVYVIFRKKHINHGYIFDGEKSWEKEQ
jgi:competence protein ComGC